MEYSIKNRWDDSIIVTVDIEATEMTSEARKLGLAAIAAVKKGANLSGANLSYANLSGANLSYANLSYANLSGANLSYADLSIANLSYANLSGDDLSYANLYGANLYGANLSYANLSGANLSYADLRGAVGADLAIARTRILPEGSIVGWKKCRKGVIVKLLIPMEARRSHAFGRKCRAEFADVLEIFDAEKAFSKHDEMTVYEVGKRVHPDKFDDDWMNECAGGIHFFITREEAEAY